MRVARLTNVPSVDESLMVRTMTATEGPRNRFAANEVRFFGLCTQVLGPLQRRAGGSPEKRDLRRTPVNQVMSSG